MKSNRDKFITAYKTILKKKHPELSVHTVNECVHGCLIAVNSELGLSPEVIQAAAKLKLTPTAESIIKYVFTPLDDEETDDKEIS